MTVPSVIALHDISIHAPRVGSDYLFPSFLLTLFNSIHAPRVESDSRLTLCLPARPDFNPRSPCGERRLQPPGVVRRGAISIHAPRVGSDALEANNYTFCPNFNPRSPCGERREQVEKVWRAH